MCLDVLLYCNVYITNLYTYYFFTYNVRKIYKIHIIKTEGKLYDSEGKLIFTIYVNINVHDQSTFTFNRKPLK